MSLMNEAKMPSLKDKIRDAEVQRVAVVKELEEDVREKVELNKKRRLSK